MILRLILLYIVIKSTWLIWEQTGQSSFYSVAFFQVLPSQFSLSRWQTKSVLVPAHTMPRFLIRLSQVTAQYPSTWHIYTYQNVWDCHKSFCWTPILEKQSWSLPWYWEKLFLACPYVAYTWYKIVTNTLWPLSTQISRTNKFIKHPSLAVAILHCTNVFCAGVFLYAIKR